MSEPLRVKTEARYKNIYIDLRKVAVKEFHELFTICVFIGHRNGIILPIEGSSKDRDRFWSDTFSEREWACFRAICLKDKHIEYTNIMDDRKVLSSIEEYANGGITVLIKDFLKDFISEKDGVFFLEESTTGDLPKRFLSYIHDSISTKE